VIVRELLTVKTKPNLHKLLTAAPKGAIGALFSMPTPLDGLHGDITAEVHLALVNEYYALRIRDLKLSVTGLNELVKMRAMSADEDHLHVTLNRYAEVLMIAGSHSQAEAIATRVYNHFTTSENLYERGMALYTLGSVDYRSMKHFEGLQKLTKANSYFLELGMMKEKSRSLKAIAHINELFDNDDKALELYYSCISVSREADDPLGESNGLVGASNVLMKKGEMAEAERLLSEAIALKKRANDVRGLAWALSTKARMLLSQTKNADSHDCAIQAHDIFKRMGEPFGLIKNLNLLGIVHIKRRMFTEATAFFTEAVQEGEKMQCADELSCSYDYLYQIAKYSGDYKSALTFHEKHLIYRENKFEQENEAELKKAAIRFEEEYNRQQQQLDAERLDELRQLTQNLTEKNRDITDSLRYASRIQKAVLPEGKILSGLFRDHFIYYKPRDIVSGDFYWFGEHERKMFVAVCDCTGHGVPAAFMSLIGHSILSEIVIKENIFRPAQVLHFLRSKLVQHLKQGTDSESGTDGMAISAICVDKENLLLEYSGSFQPVHIVRGDQLFELQPDKFHVGGYTPREEEIFENKCFQLEHGDAIYLQSDGIKDQFGGTKSKKLKLDSLLRLLVHLAPEKMKVQHSLLAQYMEEWKGPNPQVDDMLMIGLRV